MRALQRKLLRDLVHMRGQAIAIGLVMACGVATFTMSLSLLDSLGGTTTAYYERSRFAHVFALMTRAPLHLTARIAEIPGVGRVQARISERVTLDMPGMREPASGRIQSIDVDHPTGLNRLHLRAGRFPEGREAREVLVSEAFATAHGLAPGDGVRAVLNGRLDTLRVTGIALSPEYIYLMAPGSLFPDEKGFAVFWMGRDEMAAAFDMEGAFNDLAVQLTPGASEPEVIARIDDLTARYGGLGAFGRDKQTSHEFLSSELDQLSGMALIVPMIFLAVAAFLLNIVITRMIAVQREEIAALKALGYGRREIGLHYLQFVMLIAMTGAVVGVVAGGFMGRGMTGLYAEFYRFPSFGYVLLPRVVLLAFAVSGLAAVVGVGHALVTAMRLPPAEAMRPLPPTTFRPTIIERMGVHRAVSPAVRMILRQLERRPLKTAFSCLGVAMAAAILVVGSFMEDAVEFAIDFQFARVQRHDIDVAFVDRTDDAVVASVRHLPGVRDAEPYRAVSVRIARGSVSRRVGIMGLDGGDGLRHLLDMSGRRIDLPARGLVVSNLLADLLRAEVGDDVRVEVLEGRRPVVTATIAETIDDFMGMSVYMDLRELNRLLSEPGTVSGVLLAADSAAVDELYHELSEAPQVAAVGVKAAVVASFRDTVARNLMMLRSFILGFAVIIAFGVVYNTARISLSERGRELATLRVVGFTRGEISLIQLGELAVVTAIAVPLGLVIGFALAWSAAEATRTELFQMPFVVAGSTYARAAIVVIGASIVSGLVVRRRIDHLDLVSVLKSRE